MIFSNPFKGSHMTFFKASKQIFFKDRPASDHKKLHGSPEILAGLDPADLKTGNSNKRPVKGEESLSFTTVKEATGFNSFFSRLPSQSTIYYRRMRRRRHSRRRRRRRQLLFETFIIVCRGTSFFFFFFFLDGASEK